MSFDSLASGWARALGIEEKQFNMFFEKMMDGFAFCKMLFDEQGKPVDFVYLQINNAFEQITGLKRENVVGRKVSEAIPGTEKQHPELLEIYGRVAQTCKEERFEINFKPLNLWLAVSAYSPQKGYFAAVFEDITERKKGEDALRYTNERLKLISSITSDLLSTAKPQTLVQQLCEKVMAFLNCNVFFNFMVDEKKSCLHLNAYSGVPPETAKTFEWLQFGEAVCGCAAEQGERIVCENILDTDDHRAALVRSFGVQAYAANPLFSEGRVIGTLSFGSKKRPTFTPDELSLMQTVAAQVSVAMERQRNEEVLLKAKEQTELDRKRLKTILETSPSAVVMLEAPDGKISFVNKRAAQLYGFDTLGLNLDENVVKVKAKHADGTPFLTGLVPAGRALWKGEEIRNEEMIIERADGTEFSVLVSAAPLSDASGKITAAIVVFEDISILKKAEDTLRKLNRHLRAVSNSNQALMRAKDEEKYTQEVCEIVIHDCGYALAWVGIAEQDWAKTVRPVAYAGSDKGYVDQLKVSWDQKSARGRGPTGTVVRTGKPYICKNMQEDPNFTPWRAEAAKRDYTASCALPLATHEGKVFGALNIYSTESNPFTNEEVTLLTELANDFAYGIEMLRLRKEREHAEKTMQKQASLIDLSPDAIMVRQLDGTITFWSKGAEKLYGYDSKEVIGKSSHAILKTEFSEPIKEIIKELKKKNHWAGELTHQSRDGRKLTVQSYWQPTFNEKGEIVELMESNVDITNLRQMQNKLEEYAANLEELVKERTQQLKDTERLTAIGQTAGMVGHDLRNPLQTITGEMYLAKSELDELPESDAKKSLQESIATITEQISYMDKIVSDLQDFVRPINPEKRPVNLSTLVTATLAEVKIPASIEVETAINQRLPEISADPQLLKRVFINLVTNAVQAMPNGGRLAVRTKQQKNASTGGRSRILVNVQDTGEGIPDEVRSKLFTPLFTTKSKGQGFGLAVCKRVIESHGGNITFRSKVGEGTTFTVDLPV